MRSEKETEIGNTYRNKIVHDIELVDGSEHNIYSWQTAPRGFAQAFEQSTDLIAVSLRKDRLSLNGLADGKYNAMAFSTFRSELDPFDGAGELIAAMVTARVTAWRPSEPFIEQDGYMGDASSTIQLRVTGYSSQAGMAPRPGQA